MVKICYFLKRYLKLENCDSMFERFITRYYEIFPVNYSGIRERSNKRRVIISLTTIPERIDKVWLTIESLLRQSYKPDGIILWLAKDEFKNSVVPEKLKRQEERGLTIRYCDNLRSYKKFYYTVLENPNDYVVTVDDDVIYAENMLQSLLETYQKYPKCIICHRSHMIRVRKHKLLPYHRWISFDKRQSVEKEPSYSNFFVGCAGTLFPMFLMDRKVLEKKVFEKIAPTADDVWLNFIAWISGLKIKNAEDGLGEVISIESSSQKGLYYRNLHRQENDWQIEKVLEYLNIDIENYL